MDNLSPEDIAFSSAHTNVYAAANTCTHGHRVTPGLGCLSDCPCLPGCTHEYDQCRGSGLRLHTIGTVRDGKPWQIVCIEHRLNELDIWSHVGILWSGAA
jgi:hypothetical protein